MCLSALGRICVVCVGMCACMYCTCGCVGMGVRRRHILALRIMHLFLHVTRETYEAGRDVLVERVVWPFKRCASSLLINLMKSKKSKKLLSQLASRFYFPIYIC